MQRYILTRIVWALLSMIAVAVIVFFIARLTGNPLDVMSGDLATAEDRAIMARQLGLDQPLILQFGTFLKNAARGNFGNSIKYNRPAMDLVLERWPATLQLGLASILWALIIAITIGVYAAYRKDSLLDKGARLFAIMGQATPSFWLGLVLIYIFAVFLRILPAGGYGEMKYLVLPSFTFGWYVAAGIMRVTRSAMLETLDAEYVKLARAKGLPEWTVIWRHAFKNALIPVLTFSAVMFVFMLGGSLIVETIFSWPGVGRLIMEAVTWRDFPVVQAVAFLLSFLYITANLFVDLLYAWINPKIRYEK